MKTLTVVCPVFNEEAVVVDFYCELRAVLEALPESYQPTILFVVDRSNDRTLSLLEDVAKSDPCVRILALSARFGHQMSLLAGIDHCDSDVVIMMDSDLQHPPSAVPDLLRKFEEGFDIVNAIREDGDSTGLFKRVTSRLFYRLINRLSEVPIEESAADFRLISRRVARVFQLQIRERNQFLRGLFAWVGFPTAAVHFKSRRRGGGRSKYSLGKLLEFGARGIVAFSKRPLQAAVFLGFAFALIGFVLALVTIIQYFTHRSWPSGWATLAVIIPIFSGIQLIFLGILGEYVGAIFDEVKARPHYLIERKINFDESEQHATHAE
jgi:glycosyltransferase involved in cell wall biosynthesis